MPENGEWNNRAGDEFVEFKRLVAEEEKRRFVNMREGLIDVMVCLEREYDMPSARRMKKRVLDSRSTEELRLIMDGLLVVAGFNVRQTE